MAEKLARKGNRIVHSIVDSRVTLRGAGRRAEGKYFYFLKSEVSCRATLDSQQHLLYYDSTTAHCVWLVGK
jgi:predicted LPLAT superfamily acyltransferase